MSQQFPDGMKYAIRYDTTLFVREAISAVYNTLFIAGVLVLVVILLFLQNFRGMLVPATTVPVTIIGAFIALTLKPVQCATWLRPRGDKRPNWFYRGFNRAFEGVTKVYVGVVARMVKHTVLMIVLFALIVGVTAWGFVRQPTGFLPTEDQGYAVLVSILPEGASQPRPRAVAEEISALLEKTDGLAGWVTIGGVSVLRLPHVPLVTPTAF